MSFLNNEVTPEFSTQRRSALGDRVLKLQAAFTTFLAGSRHTSLPFQDLIQIRYSSATQSYLVMWIVDLDSMTLLNE